MCRYCDDGKLNHLMFAIWGHSIFICLCLRMYRVYIECKSDWQQVEQKNEQLFSRRKEKSRKFSWKKNIFLFRSFYPWTLQTHLSFQPVRFICECTINGENSFEHEFHLIEIDTYLGKKERLLKSSHFKIAESFWFQLELAFKRSINQSKCFDSFQVSVAFDTSICSVRVWNQHKLGFGYVIRPSIQRRVQYAYEQN